MHGSMRELPIRDIRPEGWLRSYLEKQLDGLTGHLEETGHPFDIADWRSDAVLERDADHWWLQEQLGYWIDGLTRAAVLLGDEGQFARMRRFLDLVIDNPDGDGYVGPARLKYPDTPTRSSRWPFAVLFRAMMAYWGATGDPRIPGAVQRHYLSGTSPHSVSRDVCNVETILWAYGQTGDEALLEHALAAYAEFNERSRDADYSYESLMSDRVATCHGVTYNEISKLGAVIYLYTGDEKYLAAAVNGFRKLDRDHMLIDGVNSSHEELIGKDPLAAHETCNIADFTWSTGYLLMATGEADYADKIERACFNAAPGAVTEDFMQLQYFSCPNQVLADDRSDHGLRSKSSSYMAFRPDSYAPCCRGNLHRIMPNYVARMWMRDAGGEGLVAAMYGPSTVSTTVGKKGVRVELEEATGYPFEEEIRFRIGVAESVEFPLFLRIPGWCEDAQVLVNGDPVEEDLRASSFYELRRTFRDGDRVVLRLPMAVRVSRWPEGAVGIERGPLVFSLPIAEEREEVLCDGCTERFKGLNLYPASEWNWAVGVTAEGLPLGLEIERREVTGDPWRGDNWPIGLTLRARKVDGWELKTVQEAPALVMDFPYYQKTGKVRYSQATIKGEFRFTPPLPDPGGLSARLGEETSIRLVPYGCTNLRITLFPHYEAEAGGD